MKERWKVVTKEIKIRSIPEKTWVQLHMIAEKYEYPSFNEFMLAQLQRIVENDGLDLYDNKFAETLADIKEQQAKILEQLLKNEIKLLAYSAKQDIVEELTIDWLRFMDDVDALAAAMKKMIEDKDKYDSEKVRKYAIDNFSPTVVVQKLLALYERVLKIPI